MLKQYRPVAIATVFMTLIAGIHFTNQAIASQAGKEYQDADGRLNQVYQTLISQIQNSTQRQKLRAAQKAWLALRDADTQFFGDYYVNSKGGLFYKTKLTKDRADYLQAIIKQAPTGDNDSFGPDQYTN
jgi:uncharacterized protein YecT (DUF1311 family)